MSFHEQIAARTILGEARGEAELVELAVAHCILNRLTDHRWGKTLGEVCLWPSQFSCWNIGDPNRRFLLSMPNDSPEVLRAIGILGRAMLEPDSIHGCLWYKNTSLSWPRDWGSPRDPVIVLGHLSFYNLDRSEAPHAGV